MTGAVKKIFKDPVGYAAEKLKNPLSIISQPVQEVASTIKSQVMDPLTKPMVDQAFKVAFKGSPLETAVSAPAETAKALTNQVLSTTLSAAADTAAVDTAAAPMADIATGSPAARAAAKRRAAALALARGGRQSTILTGDNQIPAVGLGAGKSTLGG